MVLRRGGGPLKNFGGVRSFGSTWFWIYRAEWQNRVKKNPSVGSAWEYLKQESVPGRVLQTADRSLDRLCLALEDGRHKCCRYLRQEGSPSLWSQTTTTTRRGWVVDKLGALRNVKLAEEVVDFLLKGSKGRPVQSLSTVDVSVLNRSAKIAAREAPTEFLPVPSTASRRQILAGKCRYLRKRAALSLQYSRLFRRILEESDTSYVLRLYRRLTQQPNLDIPGLNDILEECFLPKFLAAASAPHEAANQRWLEKHCSATVIGTIQALRNAEKEANFRTDEENIHYSQVLKFEWKGAHVPSHWKKAKSLDDPEDFLNLSDETSSYLELPCLLYLATLRTFSLDDLRPRELSFSMAISLLTNNVSARDKLTPPFYVNEIGILANDELKI